MSGRCNLCAEDMPSPYGPQEILDHIRNVHPEHYEEPERWPDGGIVVYEGDIDASAAELFGGEGR